MKQRDLCHDRVTMTIQSSVQQARPGAALTQPALPAPQPQPAAVGVGVQRFLHCSGEVRE